MTANKLSVYKETQNADTLRRVGERGVAGHGSKLFYKSRKKNPQKLTQLSSRSHPRHLMGKRTAQKDTIIDITSDSQVNSNFPYRWSPASLTFNNYFYLFPHLYTTLTTTNNNAPHLKSPKNQNRKAAQGRPAVKITGGLQPVCGRPTPFIIKGHYGSRYHENRKFITLQIFPVPFSSDGKWK